MQNQLDFLNYISFSTEAIAYLIFFLTAAFVAVLSMILFFHWRKYALGSRVVFALTEVLYLTVCLILLTTAFFSIN